MPWQATHDGGIDRVTPERNPFGCSRCGCYLGSMKRMAGDDYCDGCISEVLGPYAL